MRPPLPRRCIPGVAGFRDTVAMAAPQSSVALATASPHDCMAFQRHELAPFWSEHATQPAVARQYVSHLPRASSDVARSEPASKVVSSWFCEEQERPGPERCMDAPGNTGCGTHVFVLRGIVRCDYIDGHVTTAEWFAGRAHTVEGGAGPKAAR